MLRHPAEKGAIVHRQGRWVAAQPLSQLDVPDSVRDLVGRRLTHLPDETTDALAMAAALGERFELVILAEARGTPKAGVSQTLSPAVAARLVGETGVGRYHFAHALVRSTLEDALGPTRRAQLHRTAGLALERCTRR
jgi:predicted ATPase